MDIDTVLFRIDSAREGPEATPPQLAATTATRVIFP
jgi:hypothetical protein